MPESAKSLNISTTNHDVKSAKEATAGIKASHTARLPTPLFNITSKESMEAQLEKAAPLDSDGIPIGDWRELPPRTGLHGEQFPATAMVARIPFGEQHIDVLTPKESPDSLSTEQWAQWLEDNFPSFGGSKTLLQNPYLPEEERLRLTEPKAKEQVRESAAVLIQEFMAGASDSYADLMPANPDLPSVEIVFDYLDASHDEFSTAFQIGNFIVINTRALESLSLDGPKGVLNTRGIDEKPWHSSTIANVMYLMGQDKSY